MSQIFFFNGDIDWTLTLNDLLMCIHLCWKRSHVGIFFNWAFNRRHWI